MSTPQPRSENDSQSILLVEPDLSLANFLRRKLEAESYRVNVAPDCDRARSALHCEKHDLVLMDLNTTYDGIAMLRQCRPARPQLPMLVLTGSTRVEDRIESLENGADDCLSKPFSFLELAARIRALLRRNSATTPSVLRVADLQLDRESWRVERNGCKIELTPREFALLECLMANAGRPVSRSRLMQQVWNTELDPTTNVVDVYVKYVRDKVDAPPQHKLIKTIRSVGYLISEE